MYTIIHSYYFLYHYSFSYFLSFLQILLAFLTFSSISTAQETDKKKRSILGEHYQTPLLHGSFSLSNFVNFGHHAEPYYGHEEHNLLNAYSSNLPHVEHNVAIPISHSIHNTHFSLPIENFYQRERFNPYSFETPTFYQNYIPEGLQINHPAANFVPEQKPIDNVKAIPEIQQNQIPQIQQSQIPAIQRNLQNLQNPIQTRQPILALGSGSLGITKLPNGMLVLGSGSLGYIGSNTVNRSRNNNNQQESKEVPASDIAEKQNTPNSANNLDFRPSLPDPYINQFQFQPTLW